MRPCTSNSATLRMGARAVAIAALLAAAVPTAHAAGDADNDQDGWTEDEDCNDGEDRVNPGELEDCSDGLDNDCDSYTDELDADCIPQDQGCSTGPSPAGSPAVLLLLLLATARRAGPPGRSSRRCRA